ncbi:putative uridine kinase C227.14 isoform X2 [Phoenix dactylifera]|uniref:Uridine kinase C227.14 isoform X2 n=1 Tax=Phoenix dactylifera TaxID=42345 RepID=A0A8B7MTU5_PHODC|nr:putative uridine kinase C227.14 isoform X2 [Phoenix dactylifera]
MELSLSHSRGFLWRCSSSESLAVRSRQHVKWPCFPGLFSPTKRISQLMLGQSWLLSKQNNQKVLCYQKKAVPVVEGRYIVGLAGPPGAGKSTLASEVVCRINKHWSQKTLKKDSAAQNDDVGMVLPMDGFHLYRSQLDAMENPEEAHARRGAPWTFNPDLLLKCLHALRNEGSVYAPSFDHGVGDPVEDDVFVSSQHKIVIVEGNYLLLKEGAWKEVCSMFDEKWFLDVDIDTAMQRVLKRHIYTGRYSEQFVKAMFHIEDHKCLILLITVPGKEPHVAKWRVEYNDHPNAELIMKTKTNADLVIRSVDF